MVQYLFWTIFNLLLNDRGIAHRSKFTLNIYLLIAEERDKKRGCPGGENDVTF
jgi:hypothetical protein